MTSGEFKQRYLGYHAVLYRTTFSLTHDACNAEDLLQELYLKLWQKRDSLPELSNIESYLSIIMTTKSASQYSVVLFTGDFTIDNVLNVLDMDTMNKSAYIDETLPQDVVIGPLASLAYCMSF